MLDMEISAKINRFSKPKKSFPNKTDWSSYVFFINSKATIYQIISVKLKTSSYRKFTLKWSRLHSISG